MTKWQQYFQAQKGRSVRPLYKKAIEIFESSYNGARPAVAIDIGCGSGTETADLILRGFRVFAIDKEPSSMDAVRELVGLHNDLNLNLICKSFEDLNQLPQCDFIHAYASLPFCPADSMNRLWDIISGSLNAGGIFAGNFFGPNDDWVQSRSVTGTSPDQLNQYLRDFKILHQEECDKVGPTALDGIKRWHYFDIIASKRE